MDAAAESDGGEFNTRLAEIAAAAEPLVAADKNNIIVAASPAALQLLGWDEKDLCGRRVTTIIPRDLRGRHSRAFTNVVHGGKSQIIGRPVHAVASRRDDAEIPVTVVVNCEWIDDQLLFIAQLTPRN